MQNKAAGMKVLKPKKDQKVVAAYPRHADVSGRFMWCFDMVRQHDFKHLQRLANGGGHMPTQTSIVAQGRNELVRKFLDEHDADWLWFIDTDMTFDPDILDRLVERAHPRDRPIMGALCFSLQDGHKACPTLYTIREDETAGRVFNYPRDTLMRILTGTGCLLIHRSVLVAMRDAKASDGVRKLYPKPYEWFRDTSLGELPVGEDITFCIRAESLGFPVHVDTSIKCGHEKRFIVDEVMYDAQQATGVRDNDLVLPTFVVIAAKNRHVMTNALLVQLLQQNPNDIALFDNGSDPPYDGAVDAAGWPLHRMWNHGLELAEKAAREVGAKRWNVAVLNNDLQVPPNFLSRLESGLRQHDDYWISYPNYHGAAIPDGVAAITKGDPAGDGRSLCGWAFMLAGESGLRFDEQFSFWYGDSDIQRQVEAAGKHVVCVGGCFCEHLHPNESTWVDPVRVEQVFADEAKFAAKWDLDPSTLVLANADKEALLARAAGNARG